MKKLNNRLQIYIYLTFARKGEVRIYVHTCIKKKRIIYRGQGGKRVTRERDLGE